MSEPSGPFPPPHLIEAPPPWEAPDRPLPFEPEEGPQGKACRSCRRRDRPLEADLATAHEALEALEELLDWLREEHETAHGAREDAERELVEAFALLAEFDGLAAAHATALEAGRRAVSSARRERNDARRAGEAERARASRLSAELKKAKENRAAAPRDASAARAGEHTASVTPAAAARAPQVKGAPAVARGAQSNRAPQRAIQRAAAPDLGELDLALAAVAAGEGDARVLELEAALGREKQRADRYARYVEALEARLRALAEADSPGAARKAATAAPALAGAAR